ncbi:hypothetical protein KQX54_008368 [Cotesia glomerata]|uniref:Uncharacterized protein n=1 Tax=Cotesia glomerata TaxID=32391 RepID=A0AAV7IK85_COTGL|nr:hypothetical protein KQX54_008368 [Cotesia glomerata]
MILWVSFGIAELETGLGHMAVSGSRVRNDMEVIWRTPFLNFALNGLGVVADLSSFVLLLILMIIAFDDRWPGNLENWRSRWDIDERDDDVTKGKRQSQSGPYGLHFLAWAPLHTDQILIVFTFCSVIAHVLEADSQVESRDLSGEKFPPFPTRILIRQPSRPLESKTLPHPWKHQPASTGTSPSITLGTIPVSVQWQKP